MKQFSTVQAIYLSFFSRDLFRDVGQRWRKTAFLYLFLLLAVCWIPIMFKMQSRVSAFIDNDAPKLIQQVPEIKIIQGEATTDVETPYVIKDPETWAPIIIIDTTGLTTSIEGTDARILITKDSLIMKQSSSETRTIKLSEFEGLVVNKTVVRSWAEAFRQWFIIFLYPIVLLGSYAYRLIQALLYALIGKIFTKNLVSPPEYQALLSLALVSITPVILINTVYNYLDITIPFWWFLCFIAAMAYLFFAIRSFTNNSPDVTFSPPSE